MVNEQSVKETIGFLSGDKLKGRKPGTPGIELAAEYLETKLMEAGIPPYFKSYRDAISYEGIDTCNIVGCLEGRDPLLKNEYVVIGAHYDHIGTALAADSKGDIIFNGANDNASGVAAVLELAKYFASNKNNYRSILLCFFTAEEYDKRGSIHLAEKLQQQGLALYMMLNFEMIGMPLEDGMVYLTGFRKSNIIEKFNEYAGKTFFRRIMPGSIDVFLNMDSDNHSFFKKFKVPSHTTTTFNRQNYIFYHNLDDEMENIDVANITRIINEMLPVIATMVSTKDKEIILR